MSTLARLRRPLRSWAAYSHPEHTADERERILADVRRPDQAWVQQWAAELAAAVAAERGREGPAAPGEPGRMGMGQPTPLPITANVS